MTLSQRPFNQKLTSLKNCIRATKVPGGCGGWAGGWFCSYLPKSKLNTIKAFTERSYILHRVWTFGHEVGAEFVAVFASLFSDLKPLLNVCIVCFCRNCSQVWGYRHEVPNLQKATVKSLLVLCGI